MARIYYCVKEPDGGITEESETVENTGDEYETLEEAQTELERQKQLSLCQKTAVSNERIRGSGSLGGESHTAAWPFRF